jgi:dihydrofolate reductase
MKRLRYQVAVSLDGFIAGPDGEYDWIVSDSSIDFGALFKEFYTAVMGRRTYEVLTAPGGSGALTGLDVVVFSRSLAPKAAKGIRITKDDASDVVAALKKQPGRDIWLFGGGVLFRSLLDAGLVDTVEVALIPVLLGSGTPLLPPGAPARLELFDRRILPASGIVMLSYRVKARHARGARIRYIKARMPGAGRTPSTRSTTGTSNSASKRAGKKRSARKTKSV